MNKSKMRAAEQQMEAAQKIHERLRTTTTEDDRDAIQDEYEAAFHAAGDAIREAAAAEEDG